MLLGIGAIPTVQPAPPVPLAKNRARARTYGGTDETQWALEDHVCRHCFGRLVSRPLEGGRRLFRCSNCETDLLGEDVTALCACGIRLAPRGMGPALVDVTIRCRRNPNPTPDFPSTIVASEL